MIGLSLSRCVSDILSGKVALADVEKIIAGTCAYTDEKWARLIRDYKKMYWSRFDNAEIDRVIEAITPILEQPRIDNGAHYPIVAKKHWVKSETDIVWNDGPWPWHKASK